MLTAKQHELIRFIQTRLEETGISPSFEEMKEALDLASKSGIHRLITALEERGFIRRLPNRARALEVIRLPDSLTPGGQRRGFSPSVIEGSLGKPVPTPQPAPRASKDSDAGSMIPVPMMGKIAAGMTFQSYYPISPATDESTYLEAHETFLTTNGDRGSVLVVQTEDEISAVCMAAGAALTGARSAPATS